MAVYSLLGRNIECGCLTRLIDSCMYTFSMCCIWHLAAVSVVMCTVIVRPLTHFTIFTDRVLRVMTCTIWILSVIVGGANNLGVIEIRFNRVTMMAHSKRQNTAFMPAFAGINFVVATLIIMTAYTKVFLVVRRQVRSVPTGDYGSLGSSVRSAKNLFVI